MYNIIILLILVLIFVVFFPEKYTEHIYMGGDKHKGKLKLYPH